MLFYGYALFGARIVTVILCGRASMKESKMKTGCESNSSSMLGALGDLASAVKSRVDRQLHGVCGKVRKNLESLMTFDPCSGIKEAVYELGKQNKEFLDTLARSQERMMQIQESRMQIQERMEKLQESRMQIQERIDQTQERTEKSQERTAKTQERTLELLERLLKDTERSD